VNERPLETYGGFVVRAPLDGPPEELSPRGDKIEREPPEVVDEISSTDLPPEWLSDRPVTVPDRYSLLRAIAEDEETGLVELADGVWWQPKDAGRGQS